MSSAPARRLLDARTARPNIASADAMNSGNQTNLSVCVNERTACVRIAGRANFTSSVDFKRIMQRLQDDGCNEIILDLAECRLMDSTFLGVLAGIGSRCDKPLTDGRVVCVQLLRPTERVLELLDNLGVLGLFKRLDEPPRMGCFEPVQAAGASKLELNLTCLEAHQTLIEVNPENEPRFRDATEFFRKNLKDCEGGK
jgi:anti-anti-sigma factor